MPGKFGSTRKGDFGGVTRRKGSFGKNKSPDEVVQAAIPSTEAETTEASSGGGGGSFPTETTTQEQTATAAPVGPPKPKKKQTKLVAAGTFSLPGTGRAAALRSPGLVRGRIGPPSRPFSSSKKRTRGTKVKPEDEVGARGNVAAVSLSNGGFQLDDEEYAKILAGKVISGGL